MIYSVTGLVLFSVEFHCTLICMGLVHLCASGMQANDMKQTQIIHLITFTDTLGFCDDYDFNCLKFNCYNL